ncbi:MAG TPA: hypothetical protein DHU33_00365 [Firmicutes bacterium]|nr:hypothetical protein [Bacillota bacterium]
MFIDDINFFINGEMPVNREEKLVSSELGYLRGNMFLKEYVPYKNYQVIKLEAKTNEEALLLKLSQMEFALNDLSLYLDLHPNDMAVFNKFREYTNEYKRYLNEFEKTYRPLCLSSINKDSYEYYKNPWPWDNDAGVYYV